MINNLIQDLNGKRSGMLTGIFPYEEQAFKVYGEGNFNAKLVIRLKDGSDNFGQKIGFSEEQFSNPAIKDLYFEYDQQAFVEELMGAPEVVSATKELLQSFDSIEIDGSQCVVSSSESISNFDKSKIQAAAHQLSIFMKHIPLSVQDDRSILSSTDNSKKLGNILSLTGVLLFSIGFFSIYAIHIFEPVSWYETFLSTLWLGLLIAVIFTVVAFYGLKGHRTSFQEFMMCIVFGGIGLVLLTWAGATCLNGALDMSLESPHAVYNQLQPSEPCVVTTRNGFFGFEWVVSRVCSNKY